MADQKRGDQERMRPEHRDQEQEQRTPRREQDQGQGGGGTRQTPNNPQRQQRS